MVKSIYDYSLELQESARPARCRVEGFKTFEEFNTLIVIAERAKASLEKRLGRKVADLPTIDGFNEIAQNEKPYRALFLVELEGATGAIFRAWPKFPLSGEGAKEFYGGDFFVVLVTKEGEQYIEYAAVGEEKERLHEAIEELWNKAINAELMGDESEPVCPTVDLAESRTLDTEPEQLRGDSGFSADNETKFGVNTGEVENISYVAFIAPEDDGLPF